MFSRSRSPLVLLLLVGAAILALGPVGCASAQPRAHWWQFWRPKKVDAASVYHPDRVILPPPPGVIAGKGEGGGSVALGPDGLPLPPKPVDDLMGLPDPNPLRQAPKGGVAELATVYFAFDSYELDSGAKKVLDDDLRWIGTHQGVEIQIEGHCDERGTIEYNLLLGERRAKAVKAYLVQRGIAERALHTISYGEERPIDPSRNDVAFSKNRRAQFLVY